MYYEVLQTNSCKYFSIMEFKFTCALMLLLLFGGHHIAYSQNLVKTKGVAQLELTDDKSRLEVVNKVREMATIDALEKAFGRVIVQGNTTYITNLQTGQEVLSNTVFSTIANTSVKGEVQRVIDEKFTDIEAYKTLEGKKKKYIEIRCDIEIMAREIATPKINFVSFPMACTDVNCKTTAFRNNDNFFLYFSSPTSGYISVYLDERTETMCLYPYGTMPAAFEGGVPVEADKKYILFSDKPEFDYFKGTEFFRDTYQLYANNAQDLNRIFIVFSKTPLNKPSLSEVRETADNYKLPKSLPSEDFQRWLNSYRSGKDNVQVEIIDITITK